MNDSDPPDLRRADQAWFVVYTKAQARAGSSGEPGQAGLRGLLSQRSPLPSAVKGQLVASIIEPFFPRYIFLNFDLGSDNWAPLRSTRGVSSIVRFGGVPQRVPASVVAALQSNENADNLQEVKPKTWKLGDSIEIEQGPFAGYKCLFQAERGADRVTVLLNIIGKPTRTTLQKQDLQIPQFA